MVPAGESGRGSAGAARPAAAIVSSREARLFVALAGLFITNALIAEFVGVKIFALEDTLGIEPFDWRLFGQSGSLSFTAGVMMQSSPSFQLAGVATLKFEVNWSESITRSNSSKFLPHEAG